MKYRKMKIYYVVLDGAADHAISEFGNKTPLEYANTPNLDALSENGILSDIKILSEGLAPESDSGTMALLGYDPLIYYRGRGALEGLGLGEVQNYQYSASFRINFTSYNRKNNFLERRTARDLSDEELKLLAGTISRDVKLPVEYKMVAFGRYRGVLGFFSNKTELSGNVSNTDPGFRKSGNFGIAVRNYLPKPQKCMPLDDSIGAKNTADLVNIFSEKAADILEKHPVNQKRISSGLLHANWILFRDGGSEVVNMPLFYKRFQKRLVMYGQLLAEKGLAQLLGAKFCYTQAFELQMDEQYMERMPETMAADGGDVSFIHLKGPDEPGHDNKPLEKVKAIEKIDHYFFGKLLKVCNEDDIIIVTCDHATPCEMGIHSNDRVPLLLSGKYWPKTVGNRFTEVHACAAHGYLDSAVDVLDYVCNILEGK